MSINEDRAALAALIGLQTVDPELPDRMRADGVDDATVCETAGAVELALAALSALAAAAQAQARADAAAAAVDPDDQSTTTAAAAARAEADTAAADFAGLAEDAAQAARQTLRGLDRRHGGMEAAVADAGGSTRIARPPWYDR